MPRTTTNTSDIRKTARDLRTLFHGVVNTSSTAADTEVPTPKSRNRAVVSPVRVTVKSSGSCSNGGPGTRNSAGSAMMPVKNGMNNQTRLTKNHNGTADRQASASMTRYTPQ